MPTILMERVADEPETDERIAGMREQAEVCFEINDVVRKRTYVSEDRKRFVCVFEARDIESVRRSLESAGVPYERIWAAGVEF